MGKAATAYKKAAQRQDPAVFDFEAEVAQLWRDFPKARKIVTFFDASNDAKLVYPARFKGKEEAEERAERLQPKERFEEGIRRVGKRTSFCQPIFDERLVFMLTEGEMVELTDSSAPVAQNVMFTFDHEVGHAIISSATYRTSTVNRAESICDAYATIRHLQRYGADSSAIEAVIEHRAFNLVFREAWYGVGHFTSPVVEQILAHRYEIDWDNLTLRETAELAQKFAAKYGMDAAALTALHESFADSHGRSSDVKEGDDAPVRALAEMVLTTDASDVFKYGSIALRLSINETTAGELLKGPYWQKVRRALARKEKRFAKQAKPLPAHAVPKL